MEAFKPGDYICDECGDEEAATVIMMAALEDDARWFCAACLYAALALLQPPQPLDRVQEPASHADGQQGRDEG